MLKTYMESMPNNINAILTKVKTDYVLATGETEMEDEFDTYSNTIWIDMPMFSRVMHVLKQVDFGG